MEGTVVTVNEQTETISTFISKETLDCDTLPIAYKTVNMYKFSRQFSSHMRKSEDSVIPFCLPFKQSGQCFLREIAAMIITSVI